MNPALPNAIFLFVMRVSVPEADESNLMRFCRCETAKQSRNDMRLLMPQQLQRRFDGGVGLEGDRIPFGEG